MSTRAPRRRVVFCTYPSLYSSVVLSRLLQADGIELAGVVLSTRLRGRGESMPAAVAGILRHAGLSYALYLQIAASLWRWLSPQHTLKDVAEMARRHGIAVHRTADINRDDSLQFLDGCRADALLCAHFNQRVGERILQTPGLLAMNIHPSPLPARRGFDPVFAAMREGDEQLGVTLHLMDSALDEGDVLEQMLLPRDPGNSLLANNLELFQQGAALAARWLARDDAAGAARPQGGAGDYQGWPCRADVARLNRRGGRLWRLKDLRDPSALGG